MSWTQTNEANKILSKEIGAIIKDWGGKLPVALAYPNTYYVGMSSLALQILYRRFNERRDVVCERMFWDKGGLQAGRALRSLETQERADEFAVWAFTHFLRDGLFQRGGDAAPGRITAAGGRAGRAPGPC